MKCKVFVGDGVPPNTPSNFVTVEFPNNVSLPQKGDILTEGDTEYTVINRIYKFNKFGNLIEIFFEVI